LIEHLFVSRAAALLGLSTNCIRSEAFTQDVGWVVENPWRSGGRRSTRGQDRRGRCAHASAVFRPDAVAPTLRAVSLDDLARRGYIGIIVDLDNTLVGYGAESLAPEDAAWIAAARAAGFAVCLLSNNFSGRVGRVAAQLGVPGVSSALKPLPRGFRRALRLLGTPADRTVVIGDQLFTDVLGAKFTGMHAILTEPLLGHDWLGTRVLRFLERRLLGR